MEIQFNNNRQPNRNRRPPKKQTALQRFMRKFIRLPRNTRRLVMIVAALLVLAIIITLIAVPISCANRNAAKQTNQAQQQVVATEAVTEPVKANTHLIKGIPLIAQDYYKAGCETYACTMLLQGLGYKITEGEFIDNYLILQEFYYGEDGNMYGPDMDAAYAGDIFHGAGINCPAMAKSMNAYLKTQNKGQQAYFFKGKTLEQLCKEYIDKDIPVMTWVTTYMEESYEKMSWIIDYVDENCTRKEGDEMVWRQNEHCMVLIGYTDKEYIFNDSVANEVVRHDKKLAQTRFEEIGQQSVVVM